MLKLEYIIRKRRLRWLGYTYSDEQRHNRAAGPELAAVGWTQKARKTKQHLESNSERRFANYEN